MSKLYQKVMGAVEKIEMGKEGKREKGNFKIG